MPKAKLIETSKCRACGKKIVYVAGMWLHVGGTPKDRHRAEPSGLRHGQARP